jgi:hypothetical protein
MCKFDPNGDIVMVFSGSQKEAGFAVDCHAVFIWQGRNGL